MCISIHRQQQGKRGGFDVVPIVYIYLYLDEWIEFLVNSMIRGSGSMNIKVQHFREGMGRNFLPFI